MKITLITIAGIIMAGTAIFVVRRVIHDIMNDPNDWEDEK